MVTDLDSHLVERMLASLGAELQRRESLLVGADTQDFADYEDVARRDRSPVPLPRLLIVIDEFASMVRELPDFVTGLINVAQRGRSLGIHLILATQRPSGVVSPEIRANTNLWIALRGTGAAESQDVIDAAEAGHIAKRTPGITRDATKRSAGDPGQPRGSSLKSRSPTGRIRWLDPGWIRTGSPAFPQVKNLGPMFRFNV